MTTNNSLIRSLKGALALSTLLALSACGGSEFNAVETLPDDPGYEKVVDTPTDETPTTPEMEKPDTPTLSEKESILKNYDHLDPQRVINQKTLEEAVLYFHKNSSKIRNKRYLSVFDLALRSTKPRFHIIDMSSGKVWSLHAAHGKGSDSNHDGYAEKFSNTSGSNASSLGFYLTAETYSGAHGYSLRLDGLSSTNSNARRRAVVIHGAKYVKDKNVVQGRSWGCPVFSMSVRTKVIDAIKGGSLIYAIAR